MRADPLSVESPSEPDRLARIVEQTGSGPLACVMRGVDPLRGEPIVNERDRADWLSTTLMDAYRSTGNSDAMAMLFEIHRGAFLRTIQHMLPSGLRSIDPEDVLQDVFMAVCLYPRQFRADRPAAFRNWAYRILRNRMFRTVREGRRPAVQFAVDDTPFEPVDEIALSPEQAVISRESAPVVDHAYMLLLGVFQSCFENLSDRDRRLLTRVEVEGCPYGQIAADLGVKVATIKVRVFRCRQRIHARIDRMLGELAAGAIGSPGSASARSRRASSAAIMVA